MQFYITFLFLCQILAQMFYFWFLILHYNIFYWSTWTQHTCPIINPLSSMEWSTKSFWTFQKKFNVKQNHKLWTENQTKYSKVSKKHLHRNQYKLSLVKKRRRKRGHCLLILLLMQKINNTCLFRCNRSVDKVN